VDDATRALGSEVADPDMGKLHSPRFWPWRTPAHAILTAVPASAPRREFSACSGASVAEFLTAPPEAVIGRLALADPEGAGEAEQLCAWAEEIHILRKVFVGLDGILFLEFDVPRLGSRIDAALVSGPTVFPIEFKCGERGFYDETFEYLTGLGVAAI
jgi:hypothetical protein